MDWDSRILQDVSRGVPLAWECLSLVWTNILFNPQKWQSWEFQSSSYIWKNGEGKSSETRFLTLSCLCLKQAPLACLIKSSKTAPIHTHESQINKASDQFLTFTLLSTSMHLAWLITLSDIYIFFTWFLISLTSTSATCAGSLSFLASCRSRSRLRCWSSSHYLHPFPILSYDFKY